MKIRILKTSIPLICLVLTAVVFAQEQTEPPFEAVGKVIDDFHDAAATKGVVVGVGRKDQDGLARPCLNGGGIGFR